VLMLGGAFVLYLALVRPRVRRAGQEVAEANERVIRGVNESMAGIKEIRTLRIEDVLASEVGNQAMRTAEAQSRFYSLLAVPRNLMEVVLVAFVVLFSIVTLLHGDEGKQLVAVLATFGVASIRILPAVIQASSSVASMNYSIHSLDSLYKDLKYVGEHHAPGAPPAADSHSVAAQPFTDLELRDISYAYLGAGRQAITGLSMSIRRGQSIGLIGESGAGKTTLVDILLGLHPFDSGRFLINGIDVAQYGWNRWLDQVAYIPQNALLADDTLERNVAYGVPFGEIDLPRLERAIASAQLAALVARLPAGVNTVLGERGVRLSGGERQRIALARAFYHNRSVLVFDEATSALDADTERQVIEVMNGLYGEKTLIVIAHRLATVKGCDVIHKLHAGRIVSSGTFEEVIGETNNT
ncbi:MAG: ABC transporter ATP-binding protein, partial [Planctomycetota bacterium]